MLAQLFLKVDLLVETHKDPCGGNASDVDLGRSGVGADERNRPDGSAPALSDNNQTFQQAGQS